MTRNWTLIANASRARLLLDRPGTSMTLLRDFHHDKSREHSSILGDDKAGRERGPRSFGGAAFEPKLDAHRKEHRQFARELTHEIEHAANQGEFESLRIFASSPFLGELQRALGKTSRRLLSGVHDLDLSCVGQAEIAQRIRDETLA